jgi:hypothetical protein
MDNSTYDVGSAATTPREIRELRRHNLEYHHRLGNPVVFKRRKTLKDIETGKAVRCPYNYDSAYHSDISTCPYCFGTGILGGFDSGIIVFVTIGDAITDQFQLTQQGLLTRMTHPQWTAPWKPEMHDGDLIVLAQFDPDTLAITETDDRFEIDQVTPVTPRGGAPIGFAKNRNRNSFNFIPRHDMLVAQSFRADMLPEGHPWYNVPIVEPDPSSYPPLPSAPPGLDPDDYNPVPPATGELSLVMRIQGGTPGTGYSADTDVEVQFPEEYL